MKHLALPLALVAACQPKGSERGTSLDLGPDLVEVGFGEPFQIDVRAPDDGTITWKQVEGAPLEEIVVGPRGARLSARTPSLASTLPSTLPSTFPESLPWGIVPLSPRTRGEAVLEAEWTPSRGGATVRRSIRVAAAARSRGLPNVPLGQRLYLGGSGWEVTARPANATADVRELHGATTFTPDRDGIFTLKDGAARTLRVQAGRYDATPLDCGRSGCHGELAAAAQGSPMTLSLAHVLERSNTSPGAAACAVACHATGEPGTHDGGFLDVAADLGVAATWSDSDDSHHGAGSLRELPRPLRRLGAVGCLACHGPSALPETEARWSILRSDVCAYCHDAPPRYGHVAGWRASAMSQADRDPETRTRTPCVGCHTTWGFLARVSEPPPPRPDARRPPEGSVGIGCAACHDPHATNPEGTRGLLRSVRLSPFFDDLTAPARAKSAACIACHAPGADAPLAEASASLIWAGRGGVDPASGAPLTGPAPHAAVAGGCVGCHQDGPSGVERGAAHAFRAASKRCASCHRDGAATPTSLQSEARELWTKLQALGTVQEAPPGPRSRPPHASAALHARPATPLARAAWNLSLVLEDPAAASHNLPYARGLLEASRQSITRSPH